ncbi:hypothetical protein [Mycobacterium tuberculosis]|uniref:hypothetical protein n=1 Tax=Mycobacterium tuberculosis TaxID=1773 RepID=UPI00099F04CF|nr:hypothetical protein [Mycobacterium tuberculosis]
MRNSSSAAGASRGEATAGHTIAQYFCSVGQPSLLLAGHARVKVTLDRLVSFAGVRAETRPEPGLLATLPRRVLN